MVDEIPSLQSIFSTLRLVTERTFAELTIHLDSQFTLIHNFDDAHHGHGRWDQGLVHHISCLGNCHCQWGRTISGTGMLHDNQPSTKTHSLRVAPVAFGPFAFEV